MDRKLSETRFLEAKTNAFLQPQYAQENPAKWFPRTARAHLVTTVLNSFVQTKLDCQGREDDRTLTHIPCTF